MERARIAMGKSSVFVKCLLLMAGATIGLAAVLTSLNVRTLNGAIDEGIRTLGFGTTVSAAATNAGALRFGNVEALETALAFVIENSNGAARFATAFNAQGDALASAGEGGTGGSPSELREAALRAIGTGRPVVSEDGFTIVAPSLSGGTASSAAGAIAVRWSPDVKRSAARSQQTVNLAISAVVLLVLLSAAGLFLRSMISRPVATLAAEIVTLRKGRYDVSLPHTGRGDEIGTIARNLADLQEQLRDAAQETEERARIEREQKHVVETLTRALQTLAAGDLTRRVDDAFAPDYEPLRQNLNETIDTFARVIHQIANNARSIRESAETIAQGSDDLSSRTENQAASLEETAAALNMITANVETAAKSAQDVERIVVEARGRARQSSSVVKETVEAMSRIEDSSKQIGQITTVIDEIAFQTNLLALNAGVEAARAGEAGRGFSVVANEVRALAQRSSEAANQIKDLIAKSTDHVEHGVHLVASAGEELNAITDSVSTISTHVEGISNSAREQSASLAEVNSGVTQLDRVTQQNAAMVAQANESVRLLREEATAMAESIATFRLPRGNASSSGTPLRKAG